MHRLISVSLCVVGAALAVAACTRASEVDEASPPPAAAPAEAPAQATTPEAPAISTEDACRQIVERQYGQAGPAVTFLNGEISWRAPVDGGRLSFACAVDGDQVSLTREGETQTYSLNTSAADAAQEEAP